MADGELGPFLRLLRERGAAWRGLPIEAVCGPGWRGSALRLMSPGGAGRAGELYVEEVGDEVMIDFADSHVHRTWPCRPRDGVALVWTDPLAMIEAIVSEAVVSVTGWADGRIRIGSLRRVDDQRLDVAPWLRVVRVRSWLGTYDREWMV